VGGLSGKLGRKKAVRGTDFVLTQQQKRRKPTYELRGPKRKGSAHLRKTPRGYARPRLRKEKKTVKRKIEKRKTSCKEGKLLRRDLGGKMEKGSVEKNMKVQRGENPTAYAQGRINGGGMSSPAQTER